MSDFKVIGDIGETLKKILENDPWKGITPKPTIKLESPKEIKKEDNEGSTNEVSLFLYQIVENIHLKNEGSQRIGDTHLGYPPMVVDLLYLVTPYGENPEDEKYILGKVMQIFFDNAFLGGDVLKGSLSGTDEELRLLFNPLSLDDLTKIWSAFQEIGYRLSLSYIVTPVRIDSARPPQVAQRIAGKDMGYYYMASKDEGK